MISKELLSEVLGKKVVFVELEETNTINVLFGIDGKLINIYELSHKCKEWLNKIGYCYDISSTTNGLDIRVIIWNTQIKEYFHENTEHEAIFKACEWIMEQTK